MPRALISVSDKTGLTAFAARLAAAGWSFVASGGTARALRDAGLAVEDVADYTGSPEMLGGRVKTLHPAVHGGILSRGTEADRAELADRGWSELDMVVANLYPFESTTAREGATEADCVEDIDIGGVALLRAAAKNYARVAVVCDPGDYEAVAADIESTGGVQPERRRALSAKAFALCARYDAAITSWMAPDQGALLYGYAGQALRYGENPHQAARLYTDAPNRGPLGGRVLQGKELSYNNILDLDAAWRAAASFDGPAAAVVKHLSPCGVASGGGAAAALAAALACDPVSAYGGVIALNREFDEDSAAAMAGGFVECVAAASFTDGARALLSKKKNLRLLAMGADGAARARALGTETRSVIGGFLRQDLDRGDSDGAEWRLVSRRAPTDEETTALHFAWKAAVYAKSNAIVLARAVGGTDGKEILATVGLGSGQPNRVDSARLAVARAGERARGAVLASDAFFPFPDSVEVAAAAGVTAIVHPGGSIRDAESVAAADAAGMAMLVTGVRHFRH